MHSKAYPFVSDGRLALATVEGEDENMVIVRCPRRCGDKS